MNFRVNLDKPTTSSTIHKVSSKDRRCQPRRDKLPENGYWTKPVATRDGAIQEANESGLRIRYCGVCHP